MPHSIIGDTSLFAWKKITCFTFWKKIEVKPMVYEKDTGPISSSHRIGCILSSSAYMVSTRTCSGRWLIQPAAVQVGDGGGLELLSLASNGWSEGWNLKPTPLDHRSHHIILLHKRNWFILLFYITGTATIFFWSKHNERQLAPPLNYFAESNLFLLLFSCACWTKKSYLLNRGWKGAFRLRLKKNCSEW